MSEIGDIEVRLIAHDRIPRINPAAQESEARFRARMLGRWGSITEQLVAALRGTPVRAVASPVDDHRFEPRPWRPYDV